MGMLVFANFNIQCSLKNFWFHTILSFLKFYLSINFFLFFYILIISMVAKMNMYNLYDRQYKLGNSNDPH